MVWCQDHASKYKLCLSCMDGFPAIHGSLNIHTPLFLQLEGFASLLTQPLLWLSLIQHMCMFRAPRELSVTHSLARFRAVSIKSSFFQPTCSYCSREVSHYEDTENTVKSEAKCFFTVTSQTREEETNLGTIEPLSKQNEQKEAGTNRTAPFSSRKQEDCLYGRVTTASNQNPWSACQWS